MRKTKNILMVGECYSDNLGDPLLCQTVQRVLEEEWKNCRVIPLDLSGKTQMNQFYSLEKASFVQKMFLKAYKKKKRFCCRFRIFQIYRKSPDRIMRLWSQLNDILSAQPIDLVVFAGGEMFMDFFAEAIYFVIKRIGRKKVIFHACGMHALSERSIELLGDIFKQKNVRSISLRDSFSRFNDLFSLPKKTFETYDTALLCSRYFSAAEDKIADYGIGLIDNEATASCQKELVRWFLNSDKQWKIITNGSSYDVEFSKRLLNELGVEETEQERLLCPQPKTAAELVHEVTSFRYVISFRMHSQVVAASFGIPSYGLVWDRKIVEFYNKLGLEGNYADPQQPLDLVRIFDALDSVDSTKLQQTALSKGEKSKSCLLDAVKKEL